MRLAFHSVNIPCASLGFFAYLPPEFLYPGVFPGAAENWVIYTYLLQNLQCDRIATFLFTCLPCGFSGGGSICRATTVLGRPERH